MYPQYIEWHNIINGNRKKQIHRHHHLASSLGMVIKKPNTRTLGLSLLRQIQDPFPCIQTTTSVQQGVSLKTRSYSVRFTLHSSISVTSSWLRISCSPKSSQTRSKTFSPKNKKDLGMAYHTPPLKKSEETTGNAITQPRSHPICFL